MTTDPARALTPATRVLSIATLFTLFAGDFWRDFIGWPGYLALAGVLAVLNLVWVIRRRPRMSWADWPKTLLLFVALAIASIAWSHYSTATDPHYHLAPVLGVAAIAAAGLGGLAPALLLGWDDILRLLGAALRWVVGLSLLFELLVSLVIRHHILPLVKVAGIDYSGKLPAAYYWSRDNLLHGAQIQGIVGNGDLLAMCTLIALIVFSLQLAERQLRRGWAIAWIALAAVELALAHSATVEVATFGTAVVAGFALWGRGIAQHRRWPLYGTAAGLLVVGAGGILLFWTHFTAALGKSADLTGRTAIWHAVIATAKQHAVFGWGWMSYWAPWVKPLNSLAKIHGVVYLQAHDAWLDVWLQLGFVGLVVFALLALGALVRSWFLAVDRRRVGGIEAPYRAATLLPLLLMAALLVQSVAESRLLLESGWALLVLCAVATKRERG